MVLVSALALMGVYVQSSVSAPGPGDVQSSLEQVRSRVDAINAAADIPQVTQNLVPGTLERRNLAVTQFKAAAAAPPPLSKSSTPSCGRARTTPAT